MSWRRRDDEQKARWDEGLTRLEELTREFQRELGRLQKVASDSADAELADLPDEETEDA